MLPRPLSEDFAMKGLLWVVYDFPGNWFSNEKMDNEEKYFRTVGLP